MSDGQNRRLIERITHDDYVAGLEDLPLEDVKRKRDESREAETDLSFERRLCQARIEILEAELRRRRGDDDGDLVARLPEILATESPRGDQPLPSRAPDFSVPRSADVPRRRVDEIAGEQTLARLARLSPEEIEGIVSALREHERRVSERRKAAQEVLDKIQTEMVRRYQSGEADPSAALG